MKIGKATGIDDTETEHLRFAHPRLCVLLTLFFNSLIIHGLVTSVFSDRIIVPLPKGNGTITIT